MNVSPGRVQNISAADWYSESYQQARARLLSAATNYKLPVTTFCHPTAVGLLGEDLATDVIDIGSHLADRILVLVSGTHGIEGFAGSALQLRWLPRLVELADSGVRTVLVHALNPYGFSHLRRVDEGNVDVNRNFVDHSCPPARDDYGYVHDALVPMSWTGARRDTADAALHTLVRERGLRTVQAAITGGQYRYADGLFYGGTAPTWSNVTWRGVIRAFLRDAGHIAYLDLHTGLGERGKAEPIFRGGRDDDAASRAQRWYSGRLTSSEDGTSSSTPINGNTASALADEVGDVSLITAITLELGTQPGYIVLDALRGDNWLYAYSDMDSPEAPDIKQRMINAFCPRSDEWRASVLEAAGKVIGLAIDGLLVDWPS